MTDIKPNIAECCAKEENLEHFPTTNPFAYIKRCKVCGRNHYHLKAQPINLMGEMAKK